MALAVPLSVQTTRIERMFDDDLPDIDALARTDDATVVAAITGWAQAEAAARRCSPS